MGDLDSFKEKYGPGSEINRLNRSIRIAKEALKNFTGTDADKIIKQAQLKEDRKRLYNLMKG